jgi:ATP-dependent Lon protease
MSSEEITDFNEPGDEIGFTTSDKPKNPARKLPRVLPVLPVRDHVYFPHMLFPLFVGREKSIKALDSAVSKQRYIVLVAQKQISTEDPEPDDVYQVGLLAEVMQILRVPDGTVRVMLEGLERVRITQWLQTEPYFKARVKTLPTVEVQDAEAEAHMRNIVSLFEQVVQNGRNIPPEALINVASIDEGGRLADTITPYLQLRVPVKQDILETIPVKKRLESLSMVLAKEVEILEIQRNIRSTVEKEMGDTQREFILREQMKAIQQELGERDEKYSEIEEYRNKIQEAAMPQEVAERAIKEVDRLEKMPYAAPEGVVVRTYLDWLCALPWNKQTDEVLDIAGAAKVLDEDHYGLTKVKERILEFLAVRQLGER